jgi:hypothetical protein
VGDVVTLDASCSSDAEDPPDALLARFDFDGDGSWTDFAPISTPVRRAYPSAGLWTATVEVVDRRGLSDLASRYALVGAPGDVVSVTTARDESDAGATPLAPGETGLSLREAVAYVNGLGAPRIIRVDVAAPIVHLSALPPLAVQGAAIVGRPDAPLEFPGVAAGCVTLDGPNQLLLGATVTGCTATAVQLGNASDGSRIAECTVAPDPGGKGIDAKASGIIGPRNEITGASTALKLVGSVLLVEENRIHGNDLGIFAIAGNQLTLRRNRIASNRSYGLQAQPSPGSCTLLHNVFDANGDDAVSLTSFAGGVLARNNLLTRNGGYGIRDGSPSSTLDHNGFSGNARAPMSSAEPGPTDLLADPLYAGDHRLAPGSPAIDRGVDTGLHLIGPGLPLYNGAAPDLGVWEAPYPAP